MTKEEILAMMQNMPKQPEQKIGPIPEGGISQQGILDMIIGGGGMGRIGKATKGVIPYITGRNVKAVKNIKAHQNIDKLMKNADYKELLKLNPGSKIDFARRGIKLPDAKSVTPTSGGGIMDVLKKLLPWGLLGTTSDTPE